jgi:hypothetical protein
MPVAIELLIIIFFAGSCTPGTISALEGSLMVENGLQSSSTSAKVKNIQFQAKLYGNLAI